MGLLLSSPTFNFLYERIVLEAWVVSRSHGSSLLLNLHADLCLVQQPEPAQGLTSTSVG